MTIRHTTTMTDEILAAIDLALFEAETVLDPLAGTGAIHQLDRTTVGVSFDPGWPCPPSDSRNGNTLYLPFPDNTFDAIATSLTSSNPPPDHHNEVRGCTRHNRRPTQGPDPGANADQLQWGHDYRNYYYRAWNEAIRVLTPGGRFVLHIADHTPNGQPQGVTIWHATTLNELGLVHDATDAIEIPRRLSTKSQLAVAHEFVLTFIKPPHLCLDF